MREILFRGKRTDKDEWVEGMLARFNPMFEVANIIGVGERQSKATIGNGWTVDVIAHILKCLL